MTTVVPDAVEDWVCVTVVEADWVIVITDVDTEVVTIVLLVLDEEPLVLV